MAPLKAQRQHSKRSHTQLFMKEPDEPDCFHPELSAEPEESTEEESSFSEPDVKELEESPLLPEEESHGVTVVVVAARVITVEIVVTTGAGVASVAEATPSIAARRASFCMVFAMSSERDL